MGKRLADALVLDAVSIYGSDELGDPSLRLDNVSLTLEAGDWVNVVGVNGSGKSTLARLLAGLQPDGIVGEVSRGFAGEEGSPIVLQQPKAQLFGETPREEVTFALEWRGMPAETIPKLVEQTLDRVGLTLLADEPWERLSGGQQQLAALAASTAHETPLIVMDEVTSMLDEFNRNLVVRTAREFTEMERQLFGLRSGWMSWTRNPAWSRSGRVGSYMMGTEGIFCTESSTMASNLNHRA